MKNRRQSLRRRIKRGHATILWDFVLSRIYAADIPKRGRKEWLKKHKRESEYAANYLRRGRAYSEGTPEHAK